MALADAANFLSLEPLLDLCCAKIVASIMGKSVEKIRETLHIENDFTPEQEARLRRELAWAAVE